MAPILRQNLILGLWLLSQSALLQARAVDNGRRSFGILSKRDFDSDFSTYLGLIPNSGCSVTCGTWESDFGGCSTQTSDAAVIACACSSLILTEMQTCTACLQGSSYLTSSQHTEASTTYSEFIGYCSSLSTGTAAGAGATGTRGTGTATQLGGTQTTRAAGTTTQGSAQTTTRQNNNAVTTTTPDTQTTPTGTTTSPTSTSTSGSTFQNVVHSAKNHIGLIAGIAGGVVVLIVGAIILFCCCCSKKKRQQKGANKYQGISEAKPLVASAAEAGAGGAAAFGAQSNTYPPTSAYQQQQNSPYDPTYQTPYTPYQPQRESAVPDNRFSGAFSAAPSTAPTTSSFGAAGAAAYHDPYSDHNRALSPPASLRPAEMRGPSPSNVDRHEFAFAPALPPAPAAAPQQEPNRYPTVYPAGQISEEEAYRQRLHDAGRYDPFSDRMAAPSTTNLTREPSNRWGAGPRVGSPVPLAEGEIFGRQEVDMGRLEEARRIQQQAQAAQYQGQQSEPAWEPEQGSSRGYGPRHGDVEEYAPPSFEESEGSGAAAASWIDEKSRTAARRS
ncbi:hypothetical protein T439DRAFT_320728 [Meredithblackwellia eburnea MCA 4105]